MIVVYTASIGDHDEVWPYVEQEMPTREEVRWVRFSTYRPEFAHGWESLPTLHQHFLAAQPMNDRLVGRWYKCHPHLLFPDADATIWVDACIEVTSPTFVTEALACADHGYAAFPHPDRRGLRAEVAAANTLAKYAGNRHAEMVDAYEKVAHPSVVAPDAPDVSDADYGLWAMTVLARWNTPIVRAIDHLTWSETMRWSTLDSAALDQLILPFLDWTFDHIVSPLRTPAGGNLWDNEWFRRHPHLRDS